MYTEMDERQVAIAVHGHNLNGTTSNIVARKVVTTDTLDIWHAPKEVRKAI